MVQSFINIKILMLVLYLLIVIGVIKNIVYMKCHICQNKTSDIFQTKILKKYDVSYHQCSSCRFIQTDDPFWLPEAYENIITSLDIGLISRNLYLQEQVPNIINTCFTEAQSMLDYGGGYGMFVRMMRDKGFDFYRQDIYCDNLFSKHFDITDFNDKKIGFLNFLRFGLLLNENIFPLFIFVFVFALVFFLVFLWMPAAVTILTLLIFLNLFPLNLLLIKFPKSFKSEYNIFISIGVCLGLNKYVTNINLILLKILNSIIFNLS